MSSKLDIRFASRTERADLAILFQASDEKQPSGASEADPAEILERAAGVAKFHGKSMTVLDLIAPHQSPFDRVSVIGLGKTQALSDHDWLRAGGKAASLIKKAETVAVYLDAPGTVPTPVRSRTLRLECCFAPIPSTGSKPRRAMMKKAT